MACLRAAGIALLLGLLSTPVASAGSGEKVVVALGDSLTAGLGVAAEEAWPALVDARLGREGYPYRVVNAGVSGDTTAGGLRRVDWVLRSRPDVAVVALGANDGLRGLGTEAMEANLLAIVDRLRAGGARVLVVEWTCRPTTGRRTHAPSAACLWTSRGGRGRRSCPFSLDGVAADPRLNQADGIHPNAAGHRAIAEHLAPPGPAPRPMRDQRAASSCNRHRQLLRNRHRQLPRNPHRQLRRRTRQLRRNPRRQLRQPVGQCHAVWNPDRCAAALRLRRRRGRVRRGGPRARPSSSSPKRTSPPRRLVATRARGAEVVYLGEAHDNPLHHTIQTRIIEALLMDGGRPAIAFEMVPETRQAALEAAVRGDAGPGEVDRQLGWSVQGWPDFAMYWPLFELARKNGLPVVGTDLDPAVTRRISREGLGAAGEAPGRLRSALPDDPARDQAIARRIRTAHCDRISESRAERMLESWYARNVVIARRVSGALERASQVVVIIGRGHQSMGGVPEQLDALRRAPARSSWP